MSDHSNLTIFRKVFTKADFAVATSAYMERFVRSMGFGGPLRVIPNGVDSEHFSKNYPREELDALKKKLGLSVESEKVDDRGRVYRLAE